ncbi:hypothetical protein AUC68_14215 [Methyloceanibacter methanicus]|uniref:Tetratricopeptide repeat-like domain-containing protein n=1 Tax=Methyloceanibacter methanicus TaxID=1774968 RepID=A0A1E3W4J1_9HYPH|nr:hypothetical protein [Methyloceanibacter methanicus]ODS00728.1 hypothetical protein AUC68_14215 [Methyloceanibacter methanicus]
MRRSSTWYQPSVAVAVAFVFGLVTASDAGADRGTRGSSCYFQASSADKALKKSDYEAAQAGFTAAIDWTAQNCNDKNTDKRFLFENYMGRAKARTFLEENDGAAEDIAHMLQNPFVLRGKLMVGDWRWMQRALDKAIAQNPKSVTLLETRAELFEQHARQIHTGPTAPKGAETKKKLYREQLKDRTALVELATSDDDKAQRLYRRANVYEFGLKEREPALKDLDEAVKLDPKPKYAQRRKELRSKMGFSVLETWKK